MGKIRRVDTSRYSVTISRDLQMAAIKNRPGPPVRTEGLTVGFVNMTGDAPHRGELHSDGDELLYVISGRVSVTAESAPDDVCELGAGEGCIVRKMSGIACTCLSPPGYSTSHPAPTAIIAP